MEKSKNIIDRILEYLTSSLLGIMVIVALWQVCSRYVLDAPSTFSEEALRYLLIWVSILGGALAYGKKKHMAILILTNKLPDALSRRLQIIVDMIVTLFAIIVMFIGGYRAVLLAFNQASPAMEFLNVGYVYMVLPLTSVFIFFYAIYNIYHSVIRGKQYVVEKDHIIEQKESGREHTSWN
ncbi:TRAP transporter small permease [Salicibibacter cibarius]|uniref:TRAP transporter small permease n=1 Tax=Salicibibacter cibarius TaxID=2743000 RepID=A0A7T7CAX8_9BACI|nr:TRAP transporter small permease [Salicibibacter cibarius]QQK75374.1 TRAP transporter small permease [Salicibibacter cibarius]